MVLAQLTLIFDSVNPNRVWGG